MTSRFAIALLLALAAFAGPGACARKPTPLELRRLAHQAGCNAACCDPATRTGTCWPLLTHEADQDFSERLRDVVATRIHLAPGDRAADIGAGTGWFTKILADQVGPTGRVFATDIDPLATARLRDSQPPQVEPRLVARPTDTGLEDLPPGSLALVLMINSVTLIDSGEPLVPFAPGNDLGYLEGLVRLLRPGGRFLYHQDWLETENPRREETIALFARAGLEAVVETPMLAEMPDSVCMCFSGEPRPRTRGYILEFAAGAPATPR